uniref:Putative tick metalloprotease 59 n=1 Tax=Amblyomma triste TaxID=251400 RepID=A0A023G6N3_AMBTT
MIKSITGKDRGAKRGAALQGGLCSPQKIAIVKDNGRFSGVDTAAHELAHLFNSPHDGHGTSRQCPASARHLMNPHGQRTQPPKFSECSKRAIAEFIKSSAAFCLRPNWEMAPPPIL